MVIYIEKKGEKFSYRKWILDNMVIYIEKKGEKFSYDWIIW